jgi:hypothetical protein
MDRAERLLSDKYEVVPTNLERIQNVFTEKYNSFQENKKSWDKYLGGLDGITRLRTSTYYATSWDLLLETLCEKEFDKVVIRDPAQPNRDLIAMERDLARKVLALGGLP